VAVLGQAALTRQHFRGHVGRRFDDVPAPDFAPDYQADALGCVLVPHAGNRKAKESRRAIAVPETHRRGALNAAATGKERRPSAADARRPLAANRAPHFYLLWTNALWSIFWRRLCYD